MGDPLSATMSSFFMEDLESKTIYTASTHCKPTLWKRYDILEKIKVGYTQCPHYGQHWKHKIHARRRTQPDHVVPRSEHPPQRRRRQKITVYRKLTHTDQYLLWTSEHPTAHNHSVVRTLYQQANNITEDKDRQEEERHIEHALTLCQYNTIQ